MGRSTDTHAHTHVHTHVHTHSPSDCWVKQDRVCPEAQDWDLPSSKGAISFRPGLWLVALFALVKGPRGPGLQFPLSRAPGLGSLLPRVHGLSTPPHPLCSSPRPQLSLLWEVSLPREQGQWLLSGLFLSCRQACHLRPSLFPQPSHLPQCRKQCGEKGGGGRVHPTFWVSARSVFRVEAAVRSLGALWGPLAVPAHRLSSRPLHIVPMFLFSLNNIHKN